MSLQLEECAGEWIGRHWYAFGAFGTHDGFTPGWWLGPKSPHRIFLRALAGGTEVAKVEVKDCEANPDYVGVPALAEPLEIQFIEVCMGRRGQGIGRGVVQELRRLYPGRSLIALSKNADGFYESVGWSRHLLSDPDDARRSSPLYVWS